MKRIVRRVINHKYHPYAPDMLKQGDRIPFDIFIKRYDDYVIIIEAGTVLDPELHEKILLHDTIYVLAGDVFKMKEYVGENQNENLQQNIDEELESAIAEALQLNHSVALIDSLERRVRHVYKTAYNLMEKILEKGDEKVRKDAIHACAAEIVKIANSSTNIMPIFLKMTPNEYSTHHHSTNVSFFATMLSKKLGMSHDEMIEIAFAGLMHDIGKIRVDKALLQKPARLDDNEYEVVQQHSEFGYAILELNHVTNAHILDGVRYHHERLDGSGYPKGLKGKTIPKFGRIIGMCDVFDALTTDRTFRKAYSSFEALVLMKKEMSMHFMEEYIDTFIRILR